MADLVYVPHVCKRFKGLDFSSSWQLNKPPSPPAPLPSLCCCWSAKILLSSRLVRQSECTGCPAHAKGDWLRRHVWHGLANNKHLSSCHLFTSASFIKISLTFHTKFNLIDGRGRATPTHWLTLPYDRRLLYFQLTWNLLFTQLCLAHEQAAKTEIRLVLFMHISALELSPVWTRETLWSQVVYSIDIQPD